MGIHAKPVAEVKPEEMVYVMLPGIMLRQVDEWIRQRPGITIEPLPDVLQDDGTDAIPIYHLGISQERWDSMK